jgi:prepilin-type processing-associated H-X9-DG protein
MPTTCNWRRPATPHGGVMVVGMCDGSVRNVSISISSATLWIVAKADDGNPNPSNW